MPGANAAAARLPKFSRYVSAWFGTTGSASPTMARSSTRLLSTRRLPCAAAVSPLVSSARALNVTTRPTLTSVASPSGVPRVTPTPAGNAPTVHTSRSRAEHTAGLPSPLQLALAPLVRLVVNGATSSGMNTSTSTPSRVIGPVLVTVSKPFTSSPGCTGSGFNSIVRCNGTPACTRVSTAARVRRPVLSSIEAAARSTAPFCTAPATCTATSRLPVCPGFNVPSVHSTTPPALNTPLSLAETKSTPTGIGKCSTAPDASAAAARLPKFSRYVSAWFGTTGSASSTMARSSTRVLSTRRLRRAAVVNPDASCARELNVTTRPTLRPVASPSGAPRVTPAPGANVPTVHTSRSRAEHAARLPSPMQLALAPLVWFVPKRTTSSGRNTSAVTSCSATAPVLVSVSKPSTSSPGWTGSGLSSSVRCNGTPASTRVSVVARVRPPLLSSIVASARNTVPSRTAGPTRITTARLPVCPGVSVPNVHSTTPDAALNKPPSLAETKSTPAGSGRRSTTPCASVAAARLPKRSW